MYKQKLTPEEALEAIKLRMNYQVGKTFIENGGVIKEQTSAACPNSIPYTQLKAEGIKAGNIVKKMDASFIRIGYGAERAQELYNIIKSLSGKKVLDDITGECLDAIEKFKETFKITGSKGFFSGGFDLEEKLKEFMDGYYKDDEDVLRYLKATLGVLGKTFTPPSQTTSQTTTPTSQAKKTTKTKSVIPVELKDVKAFQNWLDKNHAGWATGYKDGILNQGKNGGGYGTFGPRTSKAWAQYKDEFLKGSTSTPKPQDDEVEVEVNPNDL